MSRVMKMPLLSTLAALVIIVHSAEENFEPDYRDFRPRVLDTAPVNYDQTWREAEIQKVQPPDKATADVWQDNSEPLRRRRKRKRRPQLASTEDYMPPEIYARREGSIPFQEEEHKQNIETPKRRRKKINREQESDINRPIYFNNDSKEGTHRTLRRKGQKRKRTNFDSSPEITESNKLQQPGDLHEENIEKKQPFLNNVYDIVENEKKTVGNEEKYDHTINFESTEITPQLIQQRRVDNEVADQNKILNISNRHNDNAESETSEQNKQIDPLTLKDLLKKSKGKSLSEILQQNNFSLSDLLSGKKEAVSILKLEDSEQSQEQDDTRIVPNKHSKNIQRSSFENSLSKMRAETTFRNKNSKLVLEADNNIKSSRFSEKSDDNIEEKVFTNKPKLSDNVEGNDYSNKFNIRRRFPVVRRKLRMRPLMNNSFKAQLSRDLITLSSMKYHNRNSSKFREFKDLMTPKLKMSEIEPTTVEIPDIENTETTTYIPDETVTTFDDHFNDLTTITYLKETNAVNENYDTETFDAIDAYIPFSNQKACDDKETTTLMFELEPEFYTTTTTELPKETEPPVKPYSSVRRQTFENRLKRKRMKQRTSTQGPDDYIMKDAYNMGNKVQTSEFITKTKTTKADDDTDFTTLEDFMTTDPSIEIRQRNILRKRNFYRKFITPIIQKQDIVTTEVTAKIEIQEILNDTSTSERLSKILKERNMTLRELVEQRERGSSHVHLADIFHNASREPNPPEPFLSKSLIEPISKETYPLRALLEANQHDPKATTIDSITEQINPMNKPIVMNFRNNVNENSENMGIISLFQNFSKQKVTNNFKTQGNKVEDVTHSNRNDIKEKNQREGRDLEPDKALITWNEIINLMQNQEQNVSNDISTTVKYENPSTVNQNKINVDPLEEQFGIFDDLQYLTKHLENEIAQKTKDHRNINLYDYNENPVALDPLDYNMSTTKSVTVATAAIIGLSLVLFLLTYTILKWKQDNKIYRNNLGQDPHHIPTPVFENRKGLKINSSTRSKSPMLPSSNIYAIDSLETHKGNDSPEYMWDTLRKPYQ